jgi:hypothetical protein
MEFRWVIAIALWTLLIGPIVGLPTGEASRDSNQKQPASKKIAAARPR